MEESIKILEEMIESAEKSIYRLEDNDLSGTMREVLELRKRQSQSLLNLINKYKEQEKMIELMAKDIEKITGSCPFDLYDYQVKDCDNICQTLADNGKQYTCFIEYYEKKAR